VGEGAAELIHLGQQAIIHSADVDSFVDNIFTSRRWPRPIASPRSTSCDSVARSSGRRPGRARPRAGRLPLTARARARLTPAAPAASCAARRAPMVRVAFAIALAALSPPARARTTGTASSPTAPATSSPVDAEDGFIWKIAPDGKAKCFRRDGTRRGAEPPAPPRDRRRRPPLARRRLRQRPGLADRPEGAIRKVEWSVPKGWSRERRPGRSGADRSEGEGRCGS